jgi:hypothetical protein
MTTVREAIVLPLVFLTVTLAGGLRLASMVVLQPPSLFALILALILARILVRSGSVSPPRLLSPARSAVANVNGAIVFVTLWIAAAQIFGLLIPDSGLPRLMFNVFFLILLLNTAAANPDRGTLLRTLAVTFGSVFVLKFVILAELSSPGTSWLKRVLQAMLEGVTLGTLTQQVLHPASGYIALGTIGLFLVGVFLLPADERPVITALQVIDDPNAQR